MKGAWLVNVRCSCGRRAIPFRLVTCLAGLSLLQPAPVLADRRPALLTWWVESPLIKVSPGYQAPARMRHRVDIYAARNEFQPFQIVLRSDGEDSAGIDVELSDFTASGRAEISKDHATVYLERFVNVTRPSLTGGATGLWPDPLVPRVDRYFHERRNAFPFRILKGQDQPLWIEVFVPEDARPGTYSASASVLENGRLKFSVPLSLTVWAFALPSTSSLKSSFGLNGVTALKQHRGSYTSDADLYALTRTYTQAALQHRISIHGGSLTPPKYSYQDGEITIDWRRYDDEVGPSLDGTAIPAGEPLHGAKATTTELRLPGAFDSEAQQSLYLTAWMKHFRNKGWQDRLFLYLWDEPTPDLYPKLLDRARIVFGADPEIRSLVTVPFTSKLEKTVQIWVSLVNCLEKRPGFDDFCREKPSLDAYSSELEKGKSLWFYQSCASHGCTGQGGQYFAGWPSYMIDASGMSNRVMQWIAWKYGISGELYYSMNEAWAHGGDPWTDLRLYGGNGDGTLLYPGRPALIGGRTDIPIESIRLKLIREGMQDYEYLTLLADVCGKQSAADYADRIVQKPWMWETRPEILPEIRLENGKNARPGYPDADCREISGADDVMPNHGLAVRSLVESGVESGVGSGLVAPEVVESVRKHFPRSPRGRAASIKKPAPQERCEQFAALLSRVHMPDCEEGPSQADPRREGRELARSRVPPECIAAAVSRHVDTCVSLLSHQDRGIPEHTRALVRWGADYLFNLLAGYNDYVMVEREAIEQQLEETDRRFREFATELGDAYEKERRRLAQDLHDEVGHDLIVLKLYIELIARDLRTGDVGRLRRKLNESVSLIQHAIKSVRHLTFALGPAAWSKEGFVSAIRLYVRQFAARTGLKVRFSAGQLKTTLPADYENALYKVLQGSLANAAAHADAKKVNINLSSRKDSVVMTVADDGKGFDAARKMKMLPQSFGLRAMRERIELLGGTIQFSSGGTRRGATGQGTTIELRLPVRQACIS